MALQPFVNLDRFFSFLIYTLSVGLFGRGISPSQGLSLHTEQHKHRKNSDINVSSGIRTHELAKSVHALDHAATVISTEIPYKT
jgi:hypothetical protein